MEYFEIVDIPLQTVYTFKRMYPREKILVLEGRCIIEVNGVKTEAGTGYISSLTDRESFFVISQVYENAKIIRIGGRWSTSCDTFGIFTPSHREPPRDAGDPVSYPKTNNMDSHYHDCDEYWIIYEGRGLVVSEGKQYSVGPGDCVATGRGHHHDFPIDHEPVKAVYFETDPEGMKRKGHLWEYKHGPAEPVPERV